MDFSFQPNYLLSNECMYGFDSSFDIHHFLDKVNSPLRKYRCQTGELAPDMIMRVCKKENINPKFIIVTIQKESSLITQPGSQHLHDWALGFGASDSGRNQTFKGFDKQIESAASKLNKYRDPKFRKQLGVAVGKPFQIDALLTGVHGKRFVKPVNDATLACWLYTPWAGDRKYNGYDVPYGNLLMHIAWTRYFGNPRP